MASFSMAASSSSPTDSWPLDQFGRDPDFLAYREELRSLIFNSAQTAAPSRECSPGPGGAPGPTYEESEVQAQTKAALSHGRRLDYLKNWVAEVAPWLDMFDSSKAFTVQVPVVAHRCPALLYAMLALSARQIERKEARQHSFDSLELYQEAIRLLTPLLQVHDLTIVPICVILCCLEMMSASPQDWRRHLEGCAALFDAFDVNGFSGGLLQAVFWCYARMDLCGALISDGTEATLVPLEKWLPPGADPDSAASLFREYRSPDMHANYSVYLCSKVCELVGERTRFTELGEANGCDSATFEARWLRLWNELQAWLQDRPPEIIPIQSIDSRPFPQILFVHWAGISSNQLYHTACILLLQAKPREIKVDFGMTGSAIWHAKCICGISLTNPHAGCLNNAVQPLWVAGRLLSHQSEHQLLAKLIRSIENMTGWATGWRISDLEMAWGRKVR